MGNLRIGVLASHAGGNLQAVIDALKQGRLAGEVCAVISNNSGSEALARARREGIAAFHISQATHPSEEERDAAILGSLEGCGANLVLLAGYMKRLGPRTISRYRGRILNTHPALLPRFGGRGMYGDFVHQAVLDAGEKVTGVTIHLVDEEYDHGSIVAQCEVAVLPGDTVEALRARVLERERRFVVETLGRIATGETRLGGHRPSSAERIP